VKGLAFVVPATIEAQKVQLLVDTGAQHSDIFVSSPAGQKLVSHSAQKKEPMYTASGKISARKLKAAKIVSGSFSITTDIDLVTGSADGSCARDGVLAMDVLRSCTVVFGRSKAFGKCAAK
jgi:predicted aspartyl protease